jgi:hypothetical protein
MNFFLRRCKKIKSVPSFLFFWEAGPTTPSINYKGCLDTTASASWPGERVHRKDEFETLYPRLHSVELYIHERHFTLVCTVLSSTYMLTMLCMLIMRTIHIMMSRSDHLMSMVLMMRMSTW